ncbi:caspase family protein [Bradyrhizobium sp. 24]|uniref:caspase family protein n=1 Tax=unclassified Bradyrhizobium TaxID=2631580 RepID=UPI001FF8ED0F|nr:MULTISPECIES: caspase family protein [unclassified Bradyrhizobium]MCK1300949.1 caspase family protein [Bradyrhizobium sp. 37]MCK1381795.1 caspase family protein [Bradyrhizobium sp. 24]MCK1768083.1 caspase family protein [Bradyrhizobium sp. 134]
MRALSRFCPAGLCLALLACWLSVAQASAETRVALVIGNGAYASTAKLPNPSHDAEDVAASLKRSGFEVLQGIDLRQADMQDLTIRFARAASKADVAMFYYSGHAMQYNGVNYLMPVDAVLSDEADLKRFVRVDDIVNDLQQAKNLRILILDSCRDNPLAETLKRSAGMTRAASIGRGLSKVEAPRGTIVSFSTQSGQTAADGSGRNSPYTTAFLKHIEEPQEIGEVFRDISSDVYDSSGKTQLPELSLSIIGKFYLNGPVSVTIAPAAPQAAPRADPCAAAEAHWKAADGIGTLGAYEDHLTRFPNCIFATLAKARIEGLKQKVALAPASGNARSAKDFDGNWDVTLNCPPTGKAQGFTRALSATVANGVFHADAQSQGAVNRLEIDGQIPADGKTTLSARGTTGASTYTLNNLAPGSPYAFTVDAQFDRTRGTGKRNEARACGLVFVKR